MFIVNLNKKTQLICKPTAKPIKKDTMVIVIIDGIVRRGLIKAIYRPM